MSSYTPRRPLLAAALCAGTLGLALAGTTALANPQGGRGAAGMQRHGGPAAMHERGPRGAVERTTTRTRTDDGWTRDTTWTDREGRTGSSRTVVKRDREAGIRTRETVTTLPGGETRTVNQTTTRTDDGFSSNATISGPQGTMQRQTEMVRTDNGRVVTTTVTAPSGKEMTRTVTVERDPESGTVTKRVERSGPEG